MNNIYKSIFIIPILIIGCTPSVINENKVTKEINSLDLNIFSTNGDKKYSITSPYSTYDNFKNKYQFQKATINIFQDGKTKYVLKSDESILSDNNKVLELKSNVILKTIKQDEDYLYADNFVWNIDETNYLLKGNIRFENKNVILTSEKAKMGADNIIEFFNPVKYIIKDEYNKNKYQIKSENAYYNINKESLSFGSTDKRVRSKIYF
ncbi:LPS export ABC transporter periplasmic protein LptC [uncultured Prochlorococcus sp.]|uniref:LPS export ABC transporter periplasmic protein LptC n=1 Tax=uncultured Prochlorococcus sp. TaxID=159733 RepID=UPI00258DDFEC|nr:LPS export ABC transporter periplasmic protein LptC [uncultured Prochlorococcus sp.]